MAQPAAILSILVKANTAPAARGLLRFNSTLGQTEASSNKALGALKTVGKVGIVGVGVAAGYAVKKAADFEQQMDSLGSVSGATGRQMQRFKKQALDAGAATKFSALDAAKAQTELAKGGLEVSQIMRGGLKSALALAAAGEMDLADAASTTANAMNLFSLKGKDAMKVADMLAEAANATTADVSDFAMALSQGGSVAKAAGLSFRETVLALEAMAKSGIKNSDAGTSLKTALIQLIKPTAVQAETAKKLGLSFLDAEGKMKSMSAISAMLRDKLGGMTKAQRTAALATLAGTDGVRTLTSLYAAGPEKLDKWSAGLSKTGTAATVAAQKQDNLKGKVENLMGSIETLAITVGVKMLPTFTKATVAATKFINQMSTGKGKGGEFAKALKDIWPVVRTLVIWLGKAAATALSWQRTTSKAIHAVGDFLTNVWHRPQKAFGDFIASVLRGFAKLFEAASHVPGIGGKFAELARKTRSAANRVDQLGESINKLPTKKQVKVQVDLLLKDFGAGKIPPLVPNKPGAFGGPAISDRIDQRAAVWGKDQGKTVGAAVGLGGASGSLARAVQIAGRFGLAVTSGFRPGDPGFHGQNRARDFSNGVATPQEMSFAKYMISHFGKSLLELIHTPLGFGIKNGARVPLSFWGAKTNAGHYNHVHVAMAKGGKATKKVRALVGEEGPEIVDLPAGSRVHSFSKSKRMAAAMGGLLPGFAKGGLVAGLNKIFPAHYLGQPGAQLSSTQVRAVAEKWGGLSPARALQADQITTGESTRHPGIIGRDPGGTLGIGLWQITRGVQGPLGQKWIDSRGGDTGMRNPKKNAEVMSLLSGKGTNWGNWRGTRNLGALQQNVASVLGTGGTSPKQTKKLAKQTKALKRRLRQIKGIGLSRDIEGRLRRYSGNAAEYADLADRASQLTGEGDAAKVLGHTETGWLEKQLTELFKLRNALIRAHKVVVEKREQTTKQLAQAYDFLKRHPLGKDKQGRDPVSGWTGVSPATGSMNAWNKTPIERRKKLMDRFVRRGGQLPSDRRFLPDGRVARNRAGLVTRRQVTNYREKIIPALKETRKGLNTRRGELLSDLQDVQGHSTMKLLKKLPAIGALGGALFDAQMRLRDLGAKPEITDTTSDTTRSDLLAQLLREANQRTAVSERQFDVLRNMPPYGGVFHQGGVVPGPIGAERMILARGGETVSNGQPVVNVTFGPGMDWLRQFMQVEIERGGRRATRGGRAPLPGRSGG